MINLSYVALALDVDTNKRVNWHTLTELGSDTVLVILLDGLDELLQAATFDRRSYLQEVAEFQRVEGEQNRPVAVIVTSRIIVADRVDIPEGTNIVRLNKFDDKQIAMWLESWRDTNNASIKAGTVRELTIAEATHQRHLAQQPLLLLMLAVYAADPESPKLDAGLSTSALYERIFKNFARREVLKRAPKGIASDELDARIDDQILRLSVAALAMFNRGVQHVREADLRADLGAITRDQRLLNGEGGRVLSEFFFVYAPEALIASKERSYEFLHATFGEYLIARQVVQEIIEINRYTLAHKGSHLVEDYLLHAIASFAPLSMRDTVLGFAYDQIRALPRDERSCIHQLLLRLFRDALQPREVTSLTGYSPIKASMPFRSAVYSANLCLLATMATGETTTAELFPDSVNQIDDWNRIATLWSSQLPTEGMQGLVRALAIRREWSEKEEGRIIRLRYHTNEQNGIFDPAWTYDISPRLLQPTNGWVQFSRGDPKWIHDHGRFLASIESDTILHAISPFFDRLGPIFNSFYSLPGQPHATSAAHSLFTLWLTSGRGANQDDLVDAHERCLNIALHGFSPRDSQVQEEFRALYLRQLSHDFYRMPTDWLTKAFTHIRESEDFTRLVSQIVPQLISRGGS
jgi:hypothetical protein